MKKVFLGGTCNGSNWRDTMEEHLDKLGLDYFNPVVDDWNEESQNNELRERKECNFCLYHITPKMTGTYSIAEVIDDSNKRPEKTVFVITRQDGNDKFDDVQWKSLNAVAIMVERNGGKSFDSLNDAAVFMSGK